MGPLSGLRVVELDGIMGALYTALRAVLWRANLSVSKPGRAGGGKAEGGEVKAAHK